MYIPRSFKIDDRQELLSFMRRYPFALLVTSAASKLEATHLPLEVDLTEQENGLFAATITGHFAKANPQWRHLTDDHELLVVFSGAHDYVSPTLYEDPDTVPTWNYTAVHVTGRGRIIEDETELRAMLNRLVERYEGNRSDSWRANWSNEKVLLQLKAIVGFEIEIHSIEGKKKLSQNRSEEDQRRVRSALPQLFK